MNKCFGCFICMFICVVVNYNNYNFVKSLIKVKIRGGFQSKFVVIICVVCKELVCVEVCFINVFVKRFGGGVKLIEEKCIVCEKCIVVCIVGLIYMDYDRKILIVCKYCGVCVRMCLYNCFLMEEVSE